MRFLIFVLLVAALNNTVLAAKWEIVPALSIAEIFADNIDLESDDIKQSDYITELVPSISLSINSNRFNTDLSYAVQALQFAEDTERSRVYQQLQAGAELIFVPDLFDVSAVAAIQQGVVDPTKNTGNGNITGGQNIQDVKIFGYSPQLKKRFGQSVSTRLVFNHRFVDYESEESVDTELRGIEFDIRQRSPVSRFSWGINGKENVAIYDDGRDDEVITLVLINADYELSNRFTVKGSMGYENYQLFSTLSEDAEPQARTWSVGFLWAPTPRTLMDVSYGERFFGPAYSAIFSLIGRRADIRIGGSRAVDSKANLQFSGSTSPISPVTRSASTSTPEFDNLFIRDRYFIDVAYHMMRAVFNLNLYDEVRTFDVELDDETLLGGSASFSYRIGPNTTLSCGYWYEDAKYVDGLSAIRTRVNAGISKNIATKSNVSFDYLYDERRESSEYTSHIVRLRLSVQFN